MIRHQYVFPMQLKSFNHHKSYTVVAVVILRHRQQGHVASNLSVKHGSSEVLQTQVKDDTES